MDLNQGTIKRNSYCFDGVIQQYISTKNGI